MIVYSLLFATLILAFLSLLAAYRCRRSQGFATLSQLLMAISFALFTHLYGVWVFSSVYLQYFFDVAFIAVLAYALISPKLLNRKPQLFPRLLATALFTILSIFYFTGTTGKPVGIASLSLPFHHGNYFVFQGGKGLPTNLFHYKLRTAVFAIDLVKLNATGNRAGHIFSTNLSDYEIYGDTLYSPCDATVAKTNDGNPDNIPPSRQRGPTNTNYILLQTDELYVFMAHLKPSCIFVAPGQHVATGQPIALCGNSGFSLEPHLHIQAHTNTHKALPWYKEQPLLITFNGRFYNLFQQIKAIPEIL